MPTLTLERRLLMKKRTLTPWFLSICLGLLLLSDGLYVNRMAFCQEEEEEPIQARPRPDMVKNPLKKQKTMKQQGQRRVNAVEIKQTAIADDGQHGDGHPIVADDGQHGDGHPIVADDGQHGDGIEPAMLPAVQREKPKAPIK